MLGPRFFLCTRCETVYANPPSRQCDRCDDAGLREITPALQDEPYFTDPYRR